MSKILKEKRKKRIVSFVLIFAMALTNIQLGMATVKAEAASHTWKTTAAVSLPSTVDGITLSRDSGYTESPTYSSKSLATTNWGQGTNYWQIEFSSKGMSNPVFSASMRSSNTGPRYFDMTYSIDGGISFGDILQTITITSTTLKSIDEIVLPTSAADKDSVIVRLTARKTGTVKSETAEVVNSGVSNINDIIIKDGIPDPDPEPVKPSAVDPAKITDPIDENDIAAVSGGAIIIGDAYSKTGAYADDKLNQTVTVIGQIASVYGSSGSLSTAIIQDIIDNQIVGLQVYDTLDTCKIGDVVAIKGKITEIGGIRQIQDVESCDLIRNDRTAIPAQEITWKNVEESKDYYLSEYVVFKNAEITSITDGIGALKDVSGSAITFYSPAKLPAKAEVGNKADVYGVLSRYGETYQIRNGVSESSYIGDFTGSEEEPEPTPTPTPEPSEIYDPISDEEVASGGAITIEEAYKKAANESVKIIGQIVCQYGKNGSVNTTVLQDVVNGEIVGIQVYSKMSQNKVGDIVTVEGILTDFHGVRQISANKINTVKTGVKPIEPQELTIEQLNTGKDNYLTEYVKIKNVKLGAYDEEKLRITDSTGAEAIIYQSAKYPEGMNEGDTVDVYGVWSKFDKNYQLRNGVSTNSFVGDSIIDTSITLPVVKWAGTQKPSGDVVYADKDAENDGLDTNGKLTLDENVQFNQDAKVTMLGTKGLGNTSKGKYYQLEFGTSKYGNIAMSFQMKGSNTGAKYFNVLYSSDGINFTKSDKISYTYTVYNYTTGENTTVTKTDVDTLDVITSYVTYNVKLGKEINNSQKTYIRIQVADDSTSINGGVIATGGTNYLTNVNITGSPVLADNICSYVTADPASGNARLGQEITLSCGTEGAKIYYSMNGSEPSIYDSAKKPKFNSFPAKLVVYANKEGLEESLRITYDYTQEQAATPKISPNGGAVVADTEVKISTATEGATIKYSMDEGKTWNTYTEKIKLQNFPVSIRAKAVMDGCLDSEVKTASFTQRMSTDYNVYFGQIHAHTSISDGAGTVETAFDYAKNTAEHLDFLAVTDHSNSFGKIDGSDSGNDGKNATIKDGNGNEEWEQGHAAAAAVTDDTFVGFYGYEMTWSGGAPGHMNTFNTEGFLSRNMDGYKNGSKSSLPNYYAQLKTVTDSISQFNHPGTTFGDFYDFGFFDEEVDQLITTIEVGNGEGAIGSSGYFPSYEYYTRALDKGWHVAPTNNQDNHKGKWGDSNTGRTVILADTLTEESIYDALRNMRTYATEDNDLEIQYTLNNAVMGSILEDKPDDVSIKVKLDDPTDAKIGKVEVVVNGGLAAASKEVATNEEEVTFELPADYSYYYIRVIQADGDIAVTAPVWISEVEAVGISSISTTTSLAVKGEELDITTALYNNEKTDFNIESIVYTIEEDEIHRIDLTEETQMGKVAPGEEPEYTFRYIHNGLGAVDIYVTVTGKLNGVEKVYKEVLKLNYVDPSMITRVIVDGTHYNDYVNGYYGGNVGNFADIAADDNVQVNIVTDKITSNMLEDCAVLIISAPAKKNDAEKGYQVSHFEDEFIAMVAAYAQNGGCVILCGLADYQDSKECQSSTEINKLLEAMGATTRLNSDELVDYTSNGGQEYRLYLTNYNMDSIYTKGVVEGQEYSAYNGAGVLLDKDAVADGKAEALVYGHATTESLNSRKYDDNYVSTPQGEVVSLAHESIGTNGGNVFVGGTVFISNFEVKTDLDYAGQLTYSNRNILLNILGENKKRIAPTDIVTVRKAEMGEPFAIEAYVTAGTATAGNIFFDTIYVQDDTAGITVFPIADLGIEIGQKIRIEGFVDGYQGDKELQVISYELLDGDKKIYDPLSLTAAEAMDYEANGGRLVKVEGIVKSVEMQAGDVKYIRIDDGSGKQAVVFTDGYILSSTGTDQTANIAKVGNKISAVGLIYMNPDGVCMRVRDRAEIKLISKVDSGSSSGNDSTDNETVKPQKPQVSEIPEKVETVETEISTKAVTATESSDGFFYGTDGNKVINAIVKSSDGNRYILNETGEKIVSAIVAAKNGNEYITDTSGKVVTGKIVETNGSKFYTTKNTGMIVKDKVIKIGNNKYIATETGALAAGELIKRGDDIYYTTRKTGKVVTDKLFKLNGKKYVATRSGKLVVSKWVTIDGKKYYCSKTGAITKTK